MMFSISSYGDFINLNIVSNEQGDGAVCELSKLKFYEVSSSFEKAYYFSWMMSCYYRSSEFRSYERSVKKEKIKEKNIEYNEYIRDGLDNEESVDYELLKMLSVGGGDEPGINEDLTKLRINHVRITKQDVPDESEGDVHEIGPYIYAKYNDMANAYIMKDMFEDADRIVNEYGQTIAGESGQARLRASVDLFKVKVKKKKENEDKGIKPKVEPKKVTAQLRKSSEELAQNKTSDNIVKSKEPLEKK